ncbi:MAG: GvpL/GvpF family gas vesicle protein [Nitrospirae bacterium]|nr:GvpL/GvpF family gas vesicle protein [Nitrospirota bacterium]
MGEPRTNPEQGAPACEHRGDEVACRLHVLAIESPPRGLVRGEKGLYVYCVAEGSQEIDPGLKGIEGGSVFSLSAQGLSAIVQECDAPLPTEDARRVSEWVMVHQTVVESMWEKCSAVVPSSFGAVVVPKDGKSAEENLREWLALEAESLRGKMAKLRGKAEYGVQVSWDPMIVGPRLTKNDAEIQKLEQEIQGKTPGAAYLLKQKLEGLVRRRLEAGADIYFKEFYQRIKACSLEVQVEKARREQPPRQMLANFSCLMPKGDASGLGNELEKIGRIEGFFLRFTGPWPPYSFVNL